jgi:hypothetical protein
VGSVMSSPVRPLLCLEHCLEAALLQIDVGLEPGVIDEWIRIAPSSVLKPLVPCRLCGVVW